MQLAKNIALVFFWGIIIAFSVYFFLDNVWAYVYGYRSRNFGNSLFNNQVWVVTHLAGGTFALLLGPMQFWKSFRTKYLGFHRISGKIYFSALSLQACRPYVFRW